MMSVEFLTTVRMAFAYLLCAALTLCAFLSADDASAQWEGREALLADIEKAFGDPPGMRRLSKTGRVWADPKKKRVVVDGYVCLKSGQLEMFACLVGTKEHESVVSVFAKAFEVHAGLIAVGAEKGTPVKWEPEYAPPTGSEIRIVVLWTDEEGKRHAKDARQWIRKLGSDEHLDINFVFAGSKIWSDPESGDEKYLAESGDLICVSNFSTATLDIPMQSSQVNDGLMFAAYTDRIPEEKTPVRLVLQVIDPEEEESKEKPKDESKKGDDQDTPNTPNEPGLSAGKDDQPEPQAAEAIDK